MQQEATASFPSDPPAAEPTGPAAVESTPPKLVRTGCTRRGIWPARLSMARLKPGVWFRISEPLTRASASQMASDLRNSYRRRLETLRMAGVVAGERWEAEYGTDPTDPDPTHFYVWFRLVEPAISSRLAAEVN